VSALSSSSSFADVVAAYEDNASWEEDGDLAKAKAFITACRFLLRYAQRSAKRGQGTAAEQEFNYDAVRAEMAQARAYVAEQESGTTSNPNVIHADWQGIRV